MDAAPVLTDDETKVYRSCVGALVYCVLNRADGSVLVELVGCSDSDWAGDPASWKSQSSGHVDAERPMA